MVPDEGLEPSRPFGLGILSPLRLPFRQSGNLFTLQVALQNLLKKNPSPILLHGLTYSLTSKFVISSIVAEVVAKPVAESTDKERSSNA